MRAVLQRVSWARVRVGDETTGSIGPGWLVLLGVSRDDTSEDVDALADKTRNLRGFPSEEKAIDRNVEDAGGAVLVVSQFTLYGDCRKGRRPSFAEAAPGETAEALYLAFCARLEEAGLAVGRGSFGANMSVEMAGDGPVTFLLDSRKQF